MSTEQHVSANLGYGYASNILKLKRDTKDALELAQSTLGNVE